jgi:hypothetical protein
MGILCRCLSARVRTTSPPIGAWGSSVAPFRRKRHCCITIAIQAPQAAALGYVDATLQDGEARRWPIHPHGDGVVLLPWGEVYGGFFERFTIQGVDPDAGWDGILFYVGAAIAIGYACLTNEKPGSRRR